MPDVGTTLSLINGSLLLALTLKAFWGWIFGREQTDHDHGKRLTKLEADRDALAAEIARRSHDVADKAHAALFPVAEQGNDHESRIAVLESEMGNLKARVGAIEQWRRRP